MNGIEKEQRGKGAGGQDSVSPLPLLSSAPLLAEAVIEQWTWKTPAMREMTLAIVRLALERAGEKFSANDLPVFAHGGSGICGSVFHRLVEDEVLARVGHFVENRFCPLVVSNKGGNKVGVYRLKNYARALTLLRVHGQPVPELKQAELNEKEQGGKGEEGHAGESPLPLASPTPRLTHSLPGGLNGADCVSQTPAPGSPSGADSFGNSQSPIVNGQDSVLLAEARDNAQIGADFIWAGNRKAAREHLQLALRQLELAKDQSPIANGKDIEV